MKLPLTIFVCAGLIMSASAQAGEMRLNHRFSGVTQQTKIDLNEDGVFADLISFQMKGSPGNATAQAQGEFHPIEPNPGCDAQSELVYQTFVETFKDGSMLFFMTTAGQNCVNFAPLSIEGELTGIIIGGTGRFVGATGSWMVEFEAFPVGPTMSATIGNLKGTIVVPD